jgi:hypothetical protein
MDDWFRRITCGLASTEKIRICLLKALQQLVSDARLPIDQIRMLGETA